MSTVNPTVYKVSLLVLAIVFIVAGILIPLIPSPRSDEVGNVVFWIGIAFLIVWAILLVVLEALHR